MKVRSLDWAIAVAIFAVASLLGFRLLADRQVNTIGQNLPASAMLACGRGFMAPASLSPEFLRFFRRDRSDLVCDDVAGRQAPQRPDHFSLNTRYYVYSVAAGLRLGMSWAALDRFVAVVFGLSMALTYWLFRLAVGPALSAIGVAALLFSNHILALGLDFHDFSKEFWFIALWLVLGWLLRRGRPQASSKIYVPAGLGGVLLGIGMGFRIDVVIFLPIFIAVIALALRGFSRSAITAKVAGIVLVVASFGAAGAPLLSTLAEGSDSWHVIVLGVLTPFTDNLGIETPPYDVGDLYSDGYAGALTGAHAMLVDHDQFVGADQSRQYDQQGSSLMRDLVRRFPSDALTRALGATRQVIAYPFDPIARSETASAEVLQRNAVARVLVRWRGVAAGWIHGKELLLVAFVFIAVAIRDRPTALTGVCIVCYFFGYTMLQFSRRHTFHLDIVVTALALIAISELIAFVRWIAGQISQRDARAGWAAVRRAGGAALLGIALFVAGAAVLAAARAWQQRGVTALVEQTLAGQWVDAPFGREPLSTAIERDGVPQPTWRAFYGAPRSPWSTAVLLRPAMGPTPPPAPAGHRFVRASYWMIELGGLDCAPGIVPVATVYTSSANTVDLDYSRSFDVPVANGSRLLTPVVELPPMSRFEGFAVPAARLPCVRRVRRANPPEALPMPILSLVLQADWRSGPLYQRLQRTPAPSLSTPMVLPDLTGR